MKLSPEALACLHDVAGGPLYLVARWQNLGERRQLFVYSRTGGGDHLARHVLELGRHGLIEYAEPMLQDLVLTEAGKAYVAKLTEKAA